MRTFVEAESSDDTEVVEVPYVKPTPPVILLSGSEDEDNNDDVPVSQTVQDTRWTPETTRNGSHSSPRESRGQAESTPKRAKRTVNAKGQVVKPRAKTRSEAVSGNVEPGSSARSSNSVTPVYDLCPPESDDPPLPIISISNNIFDPSYTALVESTEPEVEDPFRSVPRSTSRFVVNPINPASGVGRRVAPAPSVLPKKKTAAQTKKAQQGTKAAATGKKRNSNSASKTASESSFVSFLRSINLPIPDEFLPTDAKKKRGKQKSAPPHDKSQQNSTEVSQINQAPVVPSNSATDIPSDIPAGRVTVTQEITPSKGKGTRRGLKKKNQTAEDTRITPAELGNVTIDIQHNMIQLDTRSNLSGTPKKTGKTGSPSKKRKRKEGEQEISTPSAAKKKQRKGDKNLEIWDEDIDTPPSVIPSTWTQEMQDFYCSADQPDFDHAKIMKRQRSNKQAWLAKDDHNGFQKRNKFARTRCPNCNQLGHLRAKCPDPVKPKICHFCGEQGHTSTEGRCGYPICLNCGERTERRFMHSCDKCVYRPKAQNPVVCNLCGMRGHREQTCPDNWRRYHSTTVDIPELVKRLEVTRKELEEAKSELATAVGAAENLVQKAQAEVLDRQKLQVGPKMGFQQKLELVRAAEAELAKATERLNKKRNSARLTNAIRLLEEKAIQFESVILQNRPPEPEVVDLESDNFEGGKTHRYRAKFLVSCCNCGKPGHPSFNCSADRTWSSYVTNKTWVIRELEPPVINLPLPLISNIRLGTESNVTRKSKGKETTRAPAEAAGSMNSRSDFTPNAELNQWAKSIYTVQNNNSLPSRSTKEQGADTRAGTALIPNSTKRPQEESVGSSPVFPQKSKKLPASPATEPVSNQQLSWSQRFESYATLGPAFGGSSDEFGEWMTPFDRPVQIEPLAQPMQMEAGPVRSAASSNTRPETSKGSQERAPIDTENQSQGSSNVPSQPQGEELPEIGNAPTPPDFQVTSSSDVGTTNDVDERGARYIPVPVPIPVPAEEYAAYVKSGFTSFVPPTTPFSFAQVANPDFLNQYRIQIEMAGKAAATNVSVSESPRSSEKATATVAERDTERARRSDSPEIEVVGEVRLGKEKEDEIRMILLQSEWRRLSLDVGLVTKLSKSLNVRIALSKEEMVVRISDGNAADRGLAKENLVKYLQSKTGVEFTPILKAGAKEDLQTESSSLKVSLLPSEFSLFNNMNQDMLATELQLGPELLLLLKKDELCLTISGADSRKRELAKQNVVKFLQSKAAGVAFVPDVPAAGPADRPRQRSDGQFIFRPDEGRNQDRSRSEGPECTYCGKLGHNKHTCFDRPDRRPNPNPWYDGQGGRGSHTQRGGREPYDYNRRDYYYHQRGYDNYRGRGRGRGRGSGWEQQPPRLRHSDHIPYHARNQRNYNNDRDEDNPNPRRNRYFDLPTRQHPCDI